MYVLNHGTRFCYTMWEKLPGITDVTKVPKDKWFEKLDSEWYTDTESTELIMPTDDEFYKIDYAEIEKELRKEELAKLKE